MPILGDSFSSVLIELEQDVIERWNDARRPIQELWLDRTRKDRAIHKPAAVRNTWSCVARKRGQASIDIVPAWTDYTGSPKATAARFDAAVEHFDKLLDDYIEQLDWLR